MLGPSVMGRIPGFTAAIFPAASMPNLSLVANLGLVLFLFLVGLEVDLRFLVSNWKVALSVGAAGMALPFGLGCAIAWGLYHEFRNDQGTVPIDFPVYMLFIGVAMAITVSTICCVSFLNGADCAARRSQYSAESLPNLSCLARRLVLSYFLRVSVMMLSVGFFW